MGGMGGMPGMGGGDFGGFPGLLAVATWACIRHWCSAITFCLES